MTNQRPMNKRFVTYDPLDVLRLSRVTAAKEIARQADATTHFHCQRFGCDRRLSGLDRSVIRTAANIQNDSPRPYPRAATRKSETKGLVTRSEQVRGSKMPVLKRRRQRR